MQREGLKKLILSAVFLGIGIVLPLLTGQLKEIGDSLLPMHLPVMLCGIICGYKYGFSVGILLPFIRSLSFGMPPLYPNAVWMALELATYGLVIGLLYHKSKKLRKGHLIFALAISMIAGRIVWGISKAMLLGIAGKPFTIEAFLIGGFVDSILGIILQFIFIPLIVGIYEKTRIKTEKRKIKKDG